MSPNVSKSILVHKFSDGDLGIGGQSFASNGSGAGSINSGKSNRSIRTIKSSTSLPYNPVPLNIKFDDLISIETSRADVKEFISEEVGKEGTNNDVLLKWVNEAYQTRKNSVFQVKEDLNVEIGEYGLKA